MEPLTFQRLSEVNLDRCIDVFRQSLDWTHSEWATAMAGKSSAARSLIRRSRLGEDIAPSYIVKELAELVIYADLLATRLGLSLGACVRDRFNEVSEQREYDTRL